MANGPDFVRWSPSGEVRVEKPRHKIRIQYKEGEPGKKPKCFLPDAINRNKKIAIEIESGQAKTNYKFLKDFFEAIVLKELDYMIIAVRRVYRKNHDYNDILDYLNAYDAATNHRWPIKGLMIIGY